MSVKRILICFHDFSRGGTERIAINLARHWLEAGCDVTILCGTTEGGVRDTVDARVRVVALDPPVRRSLFSRFTLARAMGKWLASQAPDVIFLPGNFHMMLSGSLRAACPNALIIAKISNPPLPQGIARTLGAALVRRFSRDIDGFSVLNSGLARDLEAIMPGRRIKLLFDPVYIDPPISCADSNPPDGILQVLWAGRLEPQKDIALALRAVDVLRIKRPVALTILGDGSQRAKMRKHIAALGLNDVVTTPGHVKSIDGYLGRADILLMTSFYEGNPAVVQEALGHGVPVVTTDCSYFLHDLMTIAAAGKIVASRDPARLAEALNDVAAQGRPDGHALAALVAHLEPDACAQAYLDWFKELRAGRTAISA